MASLHLLRLFAVFSLLLGTRWTSAATPPRQRAKGSSDLDRFLESAESAGIVDSQQRIQLLQLASSLNLSTLSGASSIGDIPDHAQQENSDSNGHPDKRTSVFMHVYNQLTLLNVLYLSGAVVTMGAYSIFMTLAVEQCNYSTLGAMMSIQASLFGCLGIALWRSVEYMYAGGIFCTISIAMVPFVTYLIQRALKVWPKEDPGVFVGFHHWIRPGWVVMEMTTVIVGVCFLALVQFPFLLFPISFSLWYLSMDLAPLYPAWGTMTPSDRTTVRARISTTMGVAMMALGYVFEKGFGSNPDLGFWLYFFGLLTFWVSINFNYPSSDMYGSLFLLVNMGLILIGGRLDRTTFHVFGVIGVVEYVITLFSVVIKTSNSLILWQLKALAAAALLAQAIRHEGNIELLAGVVCILAFNHNYIHFITSSEAYSLLLLTANLGFVGVSRLFARPLDLWVFTLQDIELLFSVLTSLTVLLYHARVPVLYRTQLDRSGHAYLVYRALASVTLSLVFLALGQPHLAWVGGVGVPVTACCLLSSHLNTRYELVYNAVSFTILFFSVCLSLFLTSNLLYLVSCVLLLGVTMSMLDHRKKVLGCVFAMFLVLASIPLNSRFLIVIGAVYIISYLSHLAYNTFRNSLAFPLILSLLGMAMIASAVLYQWYEVDIQDGFYSLLPAVLTSFQPQSFRDGISAADLSLCLSETEFSMENFLVSPLKWALWPGALTYALVKGPAPYVAYMCIVCIFVVVSMATFAELKQRMKEPLDEKVKVEAVRFSLSKSPEHEEHGVVVTVKGTKPSSLQMPAIMALDVPASDGVWNGVEMLLGKFIVSLIRSMYLPYKITPHLVTVTGGGHTSTNFTATLLLGTGHGGSHRVKHANITRLLNQLTNHTTEMTCVLLYAKAWYHPWSKLCVAKVDLTAAL